MPGNQHLAVKYGCSLTCCVVLNSMFYRYLRNITIPAAFVTKSTGDALKELVTKKGDGQEQVIVVMDWTDALPKADKVEWEFWTNSNDQCGAVCDMQKEFIKVLLCPGLLKIAASQMFCWCECSLLQKGPQVTFRSACC